MHFNNDTDLYRTIGSNIKHYRQQANLTQMQLAEKAQISISFLIFPAYSLMTILFQMKNPLSFQ